MSMEAEQNIIGCALVDANHVVKLLEIPEDWFLNNNHKIIHRAFKALTDQNLNTDMFALDDYLSRTSGQNSGLDIGYLNGLAESLPRLNYFDSFKGVLFRDYKISNVSKISKTLANKVNANEGIEDIVGYLQEETFKLLTDHNESGPQKIGVYMKQVIAQMEWQMENPGKLLGSETGFAEFDKVLNGFQDGKMYLIAGRPGMGKSAFGLVNIGMKMAKDKPVVAFSLEMTGEALAQRAICEQAKINNYKINEAKLEPSEWDQLMVGMNQIKNESKLMIDETPGLSTAQIRARVKAEQIRHGEIGAIFVDHVGLIKKNPKKSETDALTQISHELAQMSKEFNCPMIVLCQLNRGVEQRPDKRPMMSDLKQSGALEEDARGIIMLYRDDYYDENSAQPNITEVNIIKNSDGETKNLYFQHDLSMTSYYPIDGYTAPAPEQGRKL
jgi:replicative DNA helicase